MFNKKALWPLGCLLFITHPLYESLSGSLKVERMWHIEDTLSDLECLWPKERNFPDNQCVSLPSLEMFFDVKSLWLTSDLAWLFVCSSPLGRNNLRQIDLSDVPPLPCLLTVSVSPFLSCLAVCIWVCGWLACSHHNRPYCWDQFRHWKCWRWENRRRSPQRRQRGKCRVKVTYNEETTLPLLYWEQWSPPSSVYYRYWVCTLFSIKIRK